MTTPTDLHDLLTAEAGGPSRGGPGWDDVVRRGRRHQRVRRAQRSVLAALAVGAVVTGVALSDGDPTVDTVPPVTSATTDPTPSTTVTSWVEGPPKITAARAQGAFVTVLAWIPDRYDKGYGYKPAFNLCTDLHPRVVESPDQVLVELVDETVDRGVDWAQCQIHRGDSSATIELTDPLDDRALVDAVTGDAVPVIDGARLLFPTALPAPFDVERWEERNSEDGSWAFSWTTGTDPVGPGSSGIQVLTLTRWDLDGERPTGCTEQPVEVRGVTGNLCDSESSSRLLTWAEGGGFFALEVVDIASRPLPDGIDLVAIAEGLEPLGG